MIPDDYFERFQTPKYQERSKLKRRLIRQFVERLHSLFLRANPVSSVLEVGMGEGFLSGYLSERLPNTHFEGIDLDTQSLERAAVLFPRIKIHNGSVYDLHTLGKSFDLVMCCEVLEHLAEPDRALREIAGIGPKHVIFTVPHEPFFMLSNFLRGKNIKRFGNDIDHHNHWGKKSFRALLEKRFEVVELTTSYPFILVLAKPRAA